VIKPPPKYCLVPVQPEFIENVKTGNDLLENYLRAAEYIVELESAIRCYEGDK